MLFSKFNIQIIFFHSLLFFPSISHSLSQPCGWSVCQSPATSWGGPQGFNCSIPDWDYSKGIVCQWSRCYWRRFVPGWFAGLHPRTKAVVWGHGRRLSQLLALFGELSLSKIYSMCQASGSALCYLNIATFGGSALFSPESCQKLFKGQKEQLHQLQLILHVTTL